MTEAVYAWMKNLAVFYIFLTVVMNLVPDSRYGEYIRFFMGLLLILLVLSPVMNFFKMQDSFEAFLKDNAAQEKYLESRIEEMEIDLGEKQISLEYFREEYERELEQQIERELEEKGYVAERIVVNLTVEGDMEVESMDIYFRERLDSEREQVVRDELGGDYHTAEENIRIFYEELQ